MPQTLKETTLVHLKKAKNIAQKQNKLKIYTLKLESQGG